MLRTILIVVVVLIVGLVGGAFLMRGPLASLLAKAPAGQAKPKPPEKTELVTLSERTVNLADAREQHFLKITIALELKGSGKKANAEEAKKFAEEEQAKLMDALITVTSRYSYAQLLSARGKSQLKEELKLAFVEDLKGKAWEMREVLYSDFVME